MKNFFVSLVVLTSLLFPVSTAFAADAKLKDGTYKVSFDKADIRGWKAFLEVKVKSGKLIEATYDYVNVKDGKLKSADVNYQKAMKAKTGVGPVEYTKKLAEELLAKQASGVDVVVGATSSSDNFNLLAAALLKKAASGDTKESTIPLPEEKK